MPPPSKSFYQKQINKLKSSIRRAEKKRDGAFSSLGQEVYLYYLNNGISEEPLAVSCSSIRSIDDSIEQMHMEMAGLVQERDQAAMGYIPPSLRCPICSRAVSQDATFCPHCGASMVGSVTPGPGQDQVGALTCSNCGAPLGSESRFCGDCGAPQHTEAVTATGPGVAPFSAEPTSMRDSPPVAEPAAPAAGGVGAQAPISELLEMEKTEGSTVGASRGDYGPAGAEGKAAAPPPPPAVDSVTAPPPPEVVDSVNAPPPPTRQGGVEETAGTEPRSGGKIPETAAPDESSDWSPEGQESKPSGVPRLCPKCSTWIEEDSATFCPECGAKIIT